MPMPRSEKDSGSALISVESVLSALGLEIPIDNVLQVDRLSGGLTNDNVLVTLHNTSHQIEHKIVLRRFLSKTSSHLGYDREQERHNSLYAANEKKVGAPVIGYVSPTSSHGGALAVKYIEGKTLDDVQIQSLCSTSVGLCRLVETLKKIHSRPVLFSNYFDPFKVREQYEKEVQLLTGRGVAWKGYDDIVKKLRPIQDYLEISTEDFVDCHNDLLGANFIDTDTNLTIIDWELSGQAEPSWEIGNFISENGLDGPENNTIVSSLIKQYWNDFDSASLRKKVKRAKLFSLVSKITWAAWGAVLHNLGKKDAFDYQEWCMLRLEKAKLLLDDQDAIKELCSE